MGAAVCGRLTAVLQVIRRLRAGYQSLQLCLEFTTNRTIQKLTSERNESPIVGLADDLMISTGSMEELLVKVKTWKTEMEKKGLRVNMGKTKIMESGINLDVLKKSGKYPCGVCLRL